MQISSSVGQSTSVTPLSTTAQNNKLNTDTKYSVRPISPDVEQQQSSKKPAQANIVINEQALELYEKNQASQLAQAQLNADNVASTSQDQPSAKNETAVASYQAVGNLAQRESVQALFGVDLFA
ncbi:MAG: hypothetical protein OQK09_01660 [Colwellia sp.]|nr:hypothetical protein [Colwellia sp.]MCW8865561.1 hypothetical protein [Colwellia sp.]MCW9080194.1 hypothetical protein [Colwellia sp.]